MKITFIVTFYSTLVGCFLVPEWDNPEIRITSSMNQLHGEKHRKSSVWRAYKGSVYRVDADSVWKTINGLERKQYYIPSLVEGPIVLWLNEGGRVRRALVLHPKSDPRNGLEILPVIMRDGSPEIDWAKRKVTGSDLSVEMYSVQDESFVDLVNVAQRALDGKPENRNILAEAVVGGEM